LQSVSKGEVKAEFTPSVVVGIDVGTARSGFSFAFVKRPGEIVCEQKNCSNTKTLTAVLLKASDLSFVAFGEAAQKEYLEIDPLKHNEFLYFEKFKMVLYGDDIKERPTIEAANGKRVPSVDVFAAALRYFKDQAMKRLKEASNGLVSELDVQWVVTVPAIWSAGAKQLMREAAKKAGLYDKVEAQVVLALESEAASLCCRERELQVNAAQWKPGLRYMVVDLGGGTADVTVHKVTEQQSLGEVVASSGGAWGSVYIEKEFIRLLEAIFGEKVVQSYWTSYPLDAIELLNDFERLKTSVTIKDSKSKRLRLPLSFMAHVQQQTGKNVDSLCANFALTYKPPAAASPNSSTTKSPGGSAGSPATGNVQKDQKDHKTGPGNGSSSGSTSSPAAAINFLDLQQPSASAGAAAAAATKNESSANSSGSANSGTGGFASSLLSHLMPSYVGKPQSPASTSTANALGTTPAGSAKPNEVAADLKCKSPTVATSATTPLLQPQAQKKLEEWVFVGNTELPSAPGGIPASDACVSCVRGHLKLSSELIMSLFDVVVEKIVAHVTEVLNKIGVVSHIFMAGGFSESDVVKHALESAIGPRGIRIITPPQAALAVLAGAGLFWV